MTRPVTYGEAAGIPWADALMRWQELAARDERARAAAGQADCPPLTVAEHRELLALREVLARRFQDPPAVQRALAAGVTWQQVADAAGCTAGQALARYLGWTGGSRYPWPGPPALQPGGPLR